MRVRIYIYIYIERLLCKNYHKNLIKNIPIYLQKPVSGETLHISIAIYIKNLKNYNMNSDIIKHIKR
jgi:hypothetical protein